VAGESGGGFRREESLDLGGARICVQVAKSARATRPPETTRKRLSRSEPPSVRGGSRLTPLMWPVKSVGTSESPTRRRDQQP
jgi:hypothetical protein